MSSGNSNTTTQTITSAPPEYLKDQLPAVANAARSLYDSGVGPQYYNGQTWVDFSNQTQGALSSAEAQARAGVGAHEAGGSPGSYLSPRAYNTALDVMSRNGMTGGADNALGLMGNIANGANRIDLGGYQGLLSGLPSSGVAGDAMRSGGVLDAIGGGVLDGVAPGANPSLGRLGGIATGQVGGVSAGANPSLNVLGGIASGAFNGPATRANDSLGTIDYARQGGFNGVAAGSGQGLGVLGSIAGMGAGANNADFQSALDDQANRTMNDVGTMFSNAGRYGSAYHADTAARAIGALRNAATAQQYNADIANKMAAANTATNFYQNVKDQDVARQLGSANALTGYYQGVKDQDINRQAATAGNLANFYQGALGQDLQNQIASGGLLSNFYQNAKNTDVANRMQGANLASNFFQGAYNQGIQNRLAGLQGLAGAQGANIANQGNTAQTMANLWQNAQDQSLRTALASPSLAETRYNDLARLADVGAQREAKQGEQLKDAIARFEFENQRPWNQLGLLSGAIQGVNSGGTQTSVTQRPDLPLGQRILGGGALGAGIGSTIGGPAGGLLGALGGGLLSFLQ